MAQAVVDHTTRSGLARPDDRVKPAIGELLTHHRDVGIGVEIAVTLVENGEVGQATNDRMSIGVHDDGEQIFVSGAWCDLAPSVRRASAATRTWCSSTWR
jgi:hypothetical protein